MTFEAKRIIRQHAGAVYSCCYHRDFIYSASADGFVTRWDPNTGEQDRFAIKFENAPYVVRCFEDLLFVGLNNGTLHIFDIDKRQELIHARQHNSAIFSIAVNPQTKQFYLGDAGGFFSVWDLTSLKMLLLLPLNCGKIRDMAVDTLGEQLALACQDGTLKLFDTTHYNELQSNFLHPGGLTSVLFHPNVLHRLITGGKDAHINLFDFEKEELLLHVPAHNFAVYRFLHMDDLLISASRDKSIKVWTLDRLGFNTKLEAKNGGHNHSVNDLCRMDDLRFISCGDDRRIIVWEKRTA